MARHLFLSVLVALGGCATLTESNQQQVQVQTILDNREVAGVGCILSNDVGRWFVTTPARVTIQKSSQSLSVNCRKAGAGAGVEQVRSKDNATLWGNIILTAGVGYFVDRNTGAGFDYPATLTIIMQKADEPASQAAPEAGAALF